MQMKNHWINKKIKTWNFQDWLYESIKEDANRAIYARVIEITNLIIDGIKEGKSNEKSLDSNPRMQRQF